MSVTALSPAAIETLADLLSQLGDIEPSRIRFHPPPGTATESDVLQIHGVENRLFELVDGVLVEKIMGYAESVIALAIGFALRTFVRERKLGIVSGADGMLSLAKGLIRIPDVAFISWDRMPRGEFPKEAAPSIGPDLAVEILSKGNTRREMQRKRDEYFSAGTQAVWQIDPIARCVHVFHASDESIVIKSGEILNGDPVLRGFAIPVSEIFADLDSQPATNL